MESRVHAVSLEDQCEHCSANLVLIKYGTLLAIKKMLRPNFRTLGVLQIVHGEKCYSVCPRCDAYALGADLIEPFPVLTQTGGAHGC